MDYKNFFVNYSNDLSKLLANVDTDLIKKTVELIKKKNINRQQDLYCWKWRKFFYSKSCKC